MPLDGMQMMKHIIHLTQATTETADWETMQHIFVLSLCPKGIKLNRDTSK